MPDGMNSANVILALGAVILVSVFAISSNTNATTSATQIAPGSSIRFSCPLLVSQPEQTSVLGLYGLRAYNVSGLTDYVLSPGSSGSITLATGTSVESVNNGGYATATSQGSALAAPIQNIIFYHQVQTTTNYTITKAAGSASGFNVCYSTQTSGTICKSSSSAPSQPYAVVNATISTHPGLVVSSQALNQGSTSRSELFVINANSSAEQGTYWMALNGGPCFGGQMALLTVGSSPYQGSRLSVVYS